MRRSILILVLALTLLPTAARAASWSFSTPYGTASWSLDTSAATASSTGALTLNSTAVAWGFSLDKGTTTATGSATVNDQSYSGIFDWSNLFSWL